MTDTERPYIDHTEAGEGYTVRLRANSKYTQKDGWHPADITVEYTGPADALPADLFRDRSIDLHAQISQACYAMNDREGRA